MLEVPCFGRSVETETGNSVFRRPGDAQSISIRQFNRLQVTFRTLGLMKRGDFSFLLSKWKSRDFDYVRDSST